jgi:predicted RNase H-like HicB family nuclease
MPVTHYFALLHKDADNDFRVSFPDFPGCVTGGTNLEEVFVNATLALAEHTTAIRKGNCAVPEPSSVAAIWDDAEARHGFLILVRA